MKFIERRTPLLSVKETIEMELFSSEECCVVIKTMDKDGFRCQQRGLEHPLVPDSKEIEEETELLFETPPRQEQLAKTKTKTPAKNLTKQLPPVPDLEEEAEIEMEVFPPLRVLSRQTLELQPSDSCTTTSRRTPKKAKWKSPTPPKMGLVVKDVVCLPRGLYLEQLQRPVAPRGKERAALVAMGLTARITINSSWSANQMESRLLMLFRGRFVKQAGQKFSFTYLQCVPGSRVPFVPDTPAEGWTGEQVLRTAGHGALYILSHRDYTQQGESVRTASKSAAQNNREFCLKRRSGRIPDDTDQLEEQTSPHVCSPSEELSLDLDAILRLFQQKHADHRIKSPIHVRRGGVLHGALRVVRRLGFCFRKTPIVSFIGEEADDEDDALREFFRLTLLELQQSSVFEGLLGRLLFTHDLSALEDRKYYDAGVLIGWSLTHSGPGPCCLHPALYKLMCGQNPSEEDFSWRDVVDAETRIRLQQLQNCTDVKLLSPTLRDWLSSCGYPEIDSLPSNEIPVIYSGMVKHFIYQRVSRMISQFTEGLNSCGGLWDVIQTHWELFAPVMTAAQDPPLTLDRFKQLFRVCFSPHSLQRAAEEDTAAHWEAALGLISDGQADFTLEDLLFLITRADHPPPLGFLRPISLRFSQDGDMSVHLPCSSGLELYLPTGAAGAADMLGLLSRAVHEARSVVKVQKDGATEHMEGV